MQLAFDYHSLRHTHATMQIEASANEKNVQLRLGHTDIRTTLQTYVHDTEKMDTQSVELFEKNHTRKNLIENSPTNKGEALNYRQWFTLILWFISDFSNYGGKWVTNRLNCI